MNISTILRIKELAMITAERPSETIQWYADKLNCGKTSIGNYRRTELFLEEYDKCLEIKRANIGKK